ncbi:MAG: formyltetrahydrofolate deformylase [Pseudomonadota bacterium]
MQSWVLNYSCPDISGIQSAVSTYLFEQGGFIEEIKAYSDPDTKQFISRIVFRFEGDAPVPIEDFKSGFNAVAERLQMSWSVTDQNYRPATVIAVSKFGHCLNDLLHRWKNGALPIDIKAIISNHETMRPISEWFGIPYHHIPISKQTKLESETEFYKTVEEYDTELVILARYMQILSDGLAAKLSGRCINIHHSFLPSFKGAKPYHQAHDRGVKLIGATAHYVTSDLDEGPIIEQDVERVDHEATADQLVQIGSSIEARVLSRAVQWHAEKRVFLNQNKTVVFK